MELNKLEQNVIIEEDLLKVLGLSKKQLDHLRWNKGFPCVQLSRTSRVYLADKVYEFISDLAQEQEYLASRRNK